MKKIISAASFWRGRPIAVALIAVAAAIGSSSFSGAVPVTVDRNYVTSRVVGGTEDTLLLQFPPNTPFSNYVLPATGSEGSTAVTTASHSVEPDGSHLFSYIGDLDVNTPLFEAQAGFSVEFTMATPFTYEISGAFAGGDASGNSALGVSLREMGASDTLLYHWTQTYANSFDHTLQTGGPYRIADGALIGTLPAGSYSLNVRASMSQVGAAVSPSAADAEVMFRISSAVVPEAGNTLAMLGLAVAGIARLRRKVTVCANANPPS